MSISKIKSMTEMLAKMEEMEKSVTQDVNKDLTKKRKAVLKEIFEYLDDVANSLDGRCMSVDFKNAKLFGECERGQRISFHRTYRINNSCTNTDWSKETLPWYIDCYSGHKDRNGNTWYFIDAESEPIANGKWKTGYIDLIENWPVVKAEIESGIEKELTKWMEMTRKRTEDKVNSYKIVDDFKV